MTKNKKYKVILEVVNYEYYEVEAENEDDAYDKVFGGGLDPISVQSLDTTCESIEEIKDGEDEVKDFFGTLVGILKEYSGKE